MGTHTTICTQRLCRGNGVILCFWCVWAFISSLPCYLYSPRASTLCSRSAHYASQTAAHSIFTTPLNRTHAHAHHLDHHHDPHHKHILTSSLQIHGWPDLAIGWRFQIPLLLSLGLRVVAPDMMGYGGTVTSPHPHPLDPKRRHQKREIQDGRKEITC
jgi:hypothetical protein